ncbi:MAG: hypothetical protein L3K23_04380 [Thermoplasmata archaeon]|nr:hypothetical protein [Thermoplasmata archaeon]
MAVAPVPPHSAAPLPGPPTRLPHPGFFSHPAHARTPSGDTAATLALIAFIFQVLGSALVFFLALLFFPGFFYIPNLFAILLLAIFAPIVVGTVVLLFVGYAFSYARIRDGNYEGARTATLVLGILLLFFAIIPGVLYLVAYTKLDDAIRERMWYGGYPAMAPAVPGYQYGAPLPPGPLCHRCGRPAMFVPQYGRNYCSSCGLYL